MNRAALTEQRLHRPGHWRSTASWRAAVFDDRATAAGMLAVASGGDALPRRTALATVAVGIGKPLKNERRRHRAEHIAGLDKLCDGVLPIWSGQVEWRARIPSSRSARWPSRFAAINASRTPSPPRELKARPDPLLRLGMP